MANQKTKFALMQPYFLPYIGYWQLFNESEIVFLADDSKYIKQSWINRNRLWVNGEIQYVTLPISKASDYLSIQERLLSDEYNAKDVLRRILHDYRKCQNSIVEELTWEILNQDTRNLGEYLAESIRILIGFLGINCEVIGASKLNIPKQLKAQERIFFLGEKFGIDTYVNLPGGRDLYSKNQFLSRGFRLEFIIPNLSPYETKIHHFMPSLSILDLLFQTSNKIEFSHQLNDYQLQ
jgi:hypothetical protein